MRSKRMSRLCVAALSWCMLVAGPAQAQEAGGQPAAEPPAPPPPNLKALRTLKLRFEREPSVKEVQKASLRYFQVHPERVEHYRLGAMFKALVPDLELGLNAERGLTNRDMIDALYYNAIGGLGVPWTNGAKELESNRHTTYSASLRAHWALDRLVFNAEVLDVTSLVGVQEGLLREITSLYFTRRRLMTFLELNPPQDPGERITESIRLDEITANLDALTGGYFTEELNKRLGT